MSAPDAYGRNNCRFAAGRARARGRLLELLLAHGHLPLAQRRGAAGAEVIVDFLFRQDQQQPLAHGHGGLAFLAIETRCAEIFELLHGFCPLNRGGEIKVSREPGRVNPPLASAAPAASRQLPLGPFRASRKDCPVRRAEDASPAGRAAPRYPGR